MSKTIYGSICHKCGSDSWYQYNTDKIDFSPLMEQTIIVLIVIAIIDQFIN